jgi:hypothetical protein
MALRFKHPEGKPSHDVDRKRVCGRSGGGELRRICGESPFSVAFAEPYVGNGDAAISVV